MKNACRYVLLCIFSLVPVLIQMNFANAAEDKLLENYQIIHKAGFDLWKNGYSKEDPRLDKIDSKTFEKACGEYADRIQRAIYSCVSNGDCHESNYYPTTGSDDVSKECQIARAALTLRYNLYLPQANR